MCREFSADSNPDWQQGTNNKRIEGLALISSPGGCRSQQGVASTHFCGVLPGLGGSGGGGGPQTYFKHPCLFGKHSKSEFYIMWDLRTKKKKETLPGNNLQHTRVVTSTLLHVPQGCLCVMSSNPGSCFAIFSERLLRA